MSKKRVSRSGARKPAGRKTTRWRKKAFWLLVKVSLVALVFMAIGLIWLDVQIRDKFEGKRWAVPAKVYARPLEIYPGQSLSMSELKLELKGLGYQFVRRADDPGEVEWASSRARVMTRGFDFPDGQERARNLLISFSGDKVSRITEQGRPLALTRLEPILIGGIYPQDNEDRELIRLDQAPDYLPQALIAIEDRNYYSHHGISLKGIARAMVANIKAGRFVQGGSTLTQQLIKNFYLTSDRSLVRKLTEIPMAVLLDLHYSKDEILEAYLNEVYLGQSGARAIHGFGLGSQYFFGQPVGELKLHQAALLAGLVKGPSYYDPRRHPQRAKRRRDLVLTVMADQGVITPAQARAAQAQPLGVVKKEGLHKGAYPAYLDLVKRQLRKSYHEDDLSSEGLKVFTSLDPIVQHRAERSLSSTLDKLEQRWGKRADKLEGSVVVTDSQTGDVLALVGGRNARFQGFNRALDAVRPVGSLVKPAVYLAALEQGYTLSSMIEDKPLKVELENGDIWQPDNFSRKSHGQVPLHTALAHSYNLATARLGLAIGLPKVVDMLHRLGIERELQPYPSLTLGGQTMSPYEIAGMYQTLAANGFSTPLRAIRSVTDSYGEPLTRYPFDIEQRISQANVHLVQYAMQEVAREGTARYLYRVLPDNLNVAGKTGTSNGQRDSWFAGFTGNRLAVVWVGRDDNAKLPFTGSGGALRAWTDFMRREQPEPYMAVRPEAVEYVWVDDSNGKQSAEGCPDARLLPFIAGTEPDERVACADNPIRRSYNWFKGWFR